MALRKPPHRRRCTRHNARRVTIAHTACHHTAPDALGGRRLQQPSPCEQPDGRELLFCLGSEHTKGYRAPCMRMPKQGRPICTRARRPVTASDAAGKGA